ncbi:MAG: OmpA family protein [Cytophagales bacterium]
MQNILQKIIFWVFTFISSIATVTAQFDPNSGKPINICSPTFDEFAPSLSADGKTLILQSNKDGEYKLYESQLQPNGLWSDIKPITAINSYGKKTDLVAGPSISYDGNTLYFCASFNGGWGDLDIYYSNRTAEGWSSPINIGKPINSREYEGFPSISSDGNKMYFVSYPKESSDGLTCFKILVAEKDKKGRWLEPRFLPPPINLDCDKAPRIMPDNKTIVFASIREGGKGKFDLYTSKINEAGEWEDPKPMEFVNSADNEQYATVPASGDYLFYHSKNDIIKFTIPFKYRQNKNITVQGYVTDLDTKLPLEATIVVKDAGTTQILSEQTNNAADGRYTVVLSAGKKYEITIIKKGYSTYSSEYDLTDLQEYKAYETNVELFNKINFELSNIDSELFFPIDAQITIKNEASKEILDIPYNKNDKGNKIFQLKLGAKYNFEVKANKYVTYNFNFDLTGEVKFRDLEKEVELVPNTKQFQFQISDNSTGEGILVDVYITDLDLNEQVVTQGYVTRDGKFAINLREGSRYNVEVKNPKGYAFYSTNLEVGENSNTNVNIGLLALKPDAKLLLKDIFFEYNSFEIREDSYDELLRVIQLMKENPSMTIEVAAHTDNVGSAVFNKKLSDRRAKYVVDFMSIRDVSDARLKGNGYGKEFPIVPNDTEQNRSKNRRLELKVLTISN